MGFDSVLPNQYGELIVEYVIVLSLVAIGAALAVVGLGSVLLRLFQYQQAILCVPFG